MPGIENVADVIVPMIGLSVACRCFLWFAVAWIDGAGRTRVRWRAEMVSRESLGLVRT